jgi:hypothetical protein
MATSSKKMLVMIMGSWNIILIRLESLMLYMKFPVAFLAAVYSFMTPFMDWCERKIRFA